MPPLVGNNNTRQLPMGAGHCQWGGFTDQNVCNIQREQVLRTPGRKEGGKLGNI